MASQVGDFISVAIFPAKTGYTRALAAEQQEQAPREVEAAEAAAEAAAEGEKERNEEA